MTNLVKVRFRAIKDLPPSVRVANKLPEKGFVEVRVENSTPTIRVNEIDSPMGKLREVLSANKIKINL